MDHYQNKNNFGLKTSFEIIKEAKASLTVNSVMNTRLVKTNRPFTPKNNQRILFEERIDGRPTSSVSFQKIKCQELDKNLNNPDKGEEMFRISTTKLPSLITHKSMTSLEKLPEEFEVILPEQREIYSSPALGNQSNLEIKSCHVWFPAVSAGQSKYSSFLEHDKVAIQKELTSNWLDEEKSIEENRINEARAELKSNEKDTIQNVLAAIKKKSIRGYKDEEIIILLKRLFICLESEHQLLQYNDQHLAKNLILKTVFQFIDSSNETLLLYIVQIILLLRVSGVNLSTVCKLIFKISRSDKNDENFLKKNIIGSFVNCLGLATPEDDSEALIYGYGALKFLMMNRNILECALSNGILQLMALHLKMINLAKTEVSYFPEQISHVLFQLTGCLRNVANDESTHSKFVTSGALTAICKTIRLFISDIDLVVNVARILSILSTNEECCDIIVDDDSLHTLLKICKKYPGREDIIVRVMYAIGNVLGTCERARLQLYNSSENSLEVMLNLLQYYVEADLKLSLENSFNKSHLLSVEDVFVKIIRVIANMCIDEKVGTTLVATNTSNEKVIELLDCLLIILRRKTVHENEELVISTLNALNNLSYYSHPEIKGPFIERSLDICEALNSLMSTRHEECVLEVGRVYGNLSRSLVVRKYLLETGGLNYVIDWLDSDNKDLLLITTGVLINMMIEKEARQFLKNTKGIAKMIQNLRTYGGEDWHICNLICQVIWNFSIDEDFFAVVGNEQGQNLLNILIDLLDEDRFFSNYTNQSKMFDYKLWEEFSVVATNILEKMEARHNFE